ncbi:MAG: hypothetical protein K0S24_4600 [Sphingobacterium sp.]|nr:hypothetical protein [Sphingobacterium sp.]
MTTPESHEATQIASNLEATKIIVSVKNHPLVQRINLKEVLSKKMITAKTDHLDLINTQINLPLEEKAIPSVQKIIQTSLSTEVAVHLIKMILLDLLTKEIHSTNLINLSVLLIKKIISNVLTETTLLDLSTKEKVHSIKEIVSNALTETILQDLSTKEKVHSIKEIVSNALTETILQDLSTEKKVHLIKEIVSNAPIEMILQDLSTEDSYKRFDKDDRSSNNRSRSFDKPSNRKFDGDRSRNFDENKSFDDKQYTKRPKKKAETSTEDDGLIRLNRYIANAGICSRRKADELIAAGVIWVNGEPVSELGTKVDPATDEIRYNNERLKREKMVYVLLNKPKDYITTTDDPQERHTVMELVSKATKERIYPVGRLDRNTTGLLLMTNDGNLAEKLSHPRNSISKIYNIELNKSLTQGDFNKINFGIELEDGIIKPDDLSYVQGGSKREIGIQIHSGKNRIVRRIFESLGYEVVKLDRVVYANLTKKDLPRGRWRYLEEREIVQLKHLM